MNVLITGGAGFIGSHLTRFHLEKSDKVYVIDNLSSGQFTNIEEWLDNPNFNFINEDLLTTKELPAIVKQVDRIYHLAAMVGMFRVLQDPALTLDVNLYGLQRILDLLKQQEHKPLLFVASSSEVYGNQKGRLHEDTPLIIENSAKSHAAYSISKMCNEAMAIAYYQKHAIPCIVARIFNTIGPSQTGRYGMVVPRFIEQALQNQVITIFDNGEQKRSFCDVRDTVRLFNALADNPKSIGQIVNVGNAQFISINELANTIKEVLNSHSEINYLPYEKAYDSGYIAIQERQIDTTKLFSLADYRPHFTLTDTIIDIAKQKNDKELQ